MAVLAASALRRLALLDVNLPNSITLTRIASVPLLIWALSPRFPLQGAHGEQEIIASAIFILASITDGLDGYLARRPWIAVLVIGREFLVSGLRSIASSEGFTIQASELGKLKTVIQIVSVVAAILNHRWDYWHFGWFPIGVHLIAVTAIYWMAIISIISAVDYFIGFWKKIDHVSGRRRRRSSVLSRKKREPAPTISSPS